MSLSLHNHCPYTFFSDKYIDNSSVNNPYSQFHDVYTLEQILASPVQHKFMTKLQCCPTSDGSAAVILCSQKFLDSHPELKSQVPQSPSTNLSPRMSPDWTFPSVFYNKFIPTPSRTGIFVHSHPESTESLHLDLILDWILTNILGN